jgi:D-alanyl-D-alanine dipeptidase
MSREEHAMIATSRIRRTEWLLALLLLPTLLVGRAAMAKESLPDGFVRLADIDPNIREDMRYATARNVTGAALPGYGAPACLLREEAALALSRVQAALKDKGLGLVVFDCYRPQRAVSALVAWAATPGAQRRGPAHPGIDRSALVEKGYIAARSLHATGYAVDLALAPLASPAVPREGQAMDDGALCTASQAERGDGDLLDFGTTFDCFDPAASTDAPGQSPVVRTNRRLLIEAMTAQGFTSYRREWWHFSYARRGKAKAHDFPIIAP